MGLLVEILLLQSNLIGANRNLYETITYATYSFHKGAWVGILVYSELVSHSGGLGNNLASFHLQGLCFVSVLCERGRVALSAMCDSHSTQQCFATFATEKPIQSFKVGRVGDDELFGKLRVNVSPMFEYSSQTGETPLRSSVTAGTSS